MAHQLGQFSIAVALLAGALYQLSGSVSVIEPGTVRSVFYSPH
jgi:hypothetical protein